MKIIDIAPKSEETRWKLQQIVLHGGGYVVAVIAGVIAFAIAVGEHRSAYIALLWFVGVFTCFAIAAVFLYKVVKRDRVISQLSDRLEILQDRNLRLEQELFNLSMQAAKLSPQPQAASGGSETAKMFVNQTPTDGVHLDAQVQQVTAAQALAEIESKKDTMTLAEYKTLIREFGKQKSKEWIKPKTRLLEIRDKMVQRGLWEVS